MAQAAQELADAFRQGYNLAAQTSRIGTARVGSESDLPSFLVERGAQHLQVSLLTTASTPAGYLGLIDPDGTWHSPSRYGTNSSVYRVDSPVPGTWTWNAAYTPTPSPTPTIFVEEVVTSPLVLLAVADVEHAVSGRYETDDERWVGKDVFIQAVPTDGSDLFGIAVTGTLTAPTGAT